MKCKRSGRWCETLVRHCFFLDFFQVEAQIAVTLASELASTRGGNDLRPILSSVASHSSHRRSLREARWPLNNLSVQPVGGGGGSEHQTPHARASGGGGSCKIPSDSNFRTSGRRLRGGRFLSGWLISRELRGRNSQISHFATGQFPARVKVAQPVCVATALKCEFVVQFCWRSDLTASPPS